MTEQSEQAELILLHPGPHRRILLGTKTTIGSGDRCDICLLDSQIAPLHATITRVGSNWIIRAVTGALVRINDRPISEAALIDRDVFQIGEVLIGFRRLLGTLAVAQPPVPASLKALREDVVDQRAGLLEERTAWDNELERRREDLRIREEAFRARAARCARGIERERERNHRKQLQNERRAQELDRLAQKFAEQKKRLEFERLENRVQSRHLDERYSALEERWKLFERQRQSLEKDLGDRRAELNSLVLEIERRQAEWEALQRLPDNAPAGVALAYREMMLTAQERELHDCEDELHAITIQTDRLLAELERRLVAAEQEKAPWPISPLNQQPTSEDDSPENSVIPMASHPPMSPTRSWDQLVREERQDAEMRAWRSEKTASALNLEWEWDQLSQAKRRLHEAEARFAAEVARERENLHREREAVDRRRGWIDRGQFRLGMLQARALQIRLAPFLSRPEIGDALKQINELTELWQQVRCDALRERLELTCERERFALKDKELVRLRRLVHKQKGLLAGLVAELNTATRLRQLERAVQDQNQREREQAIERLVHSLIGNSATETTDSEETILSIPPLRRAG